MAKTTTSYDPIRPLDLQDPTLTKLNLKLQNNASQLASLGTTLNPNASQTANAWQPWTLNIITTMDYKVTSILEANYLEQANMVFVNLDIQLNLSGTATNFITFSPPANILPATNSGNAMAAFSFDSAAAIPVFARTENNGIIVIPFVGPYSLGLVEIVVSGWYRI